MTFNRIIAPVDGSEQSIKSVKKAISLGKELNLDVLAIYVVDVGPYTSILPPEQTYEIWKNAIEEEAQKTLNKVEKIADENNAKVKTMMLKGTPDEEIVKEAKKKDLIIMGNKGKSAVDRVLIGSVSEKVLHHSDATVMIVR